jgi:hypothetical protein
MVLGEEMMKRLVTTWALLVVLFGLAGVAEAVRPAARNFISVSTTPSTLALGMSTHPGMHESAGALTVAVEANCLHGPILISTTKLKRKGGGLIPPDRISVRTPATGGFVNMAKPVAISKPEKGPHKIVLDFRVQTGFEDPAGRYAGSITFTVMPPS